MFSLHLWRSVDADFCISLAYVMSGMKQSFWFQNIPASGGLKRKNARKNINFGLKPLLQEIQLKNLTIRKIFWSFNI